ncbi:MAG TPA: methyltransferase domain-containing protein [Mucilaginibacter sp.]|nr:methyltransferase domain-containing protein [Mucilaginibacter sp.]
MKWNAELYDEKHAFVFQYGESVLKLLDVKPGETILDLGCGTGHLANEIKNLGAEVTAIDASADMIEKAEKLYPEVDFKVADGANFHFNKPFDAVFSNAALHWMPRADDVIKCVYESLKPGGRFIAEMGGKGNMAHMIAATRQVLDKHGYHRPGDSGPWYFPSIGEYAGKLEARGFRVTFAMHFDRPTLLQDGRQGISKWLAMFGASFFEGIPKAELQEMLEEIADLLEPVYNNNGDWFADYKRLRFIAVK